VTAGQVDEARARAREWEPVAEVFAGSAWPAMLEARMKRLEITRPE
jgi:hypothetical protein